MWWHLSNIVPDNKVESDDQDEDDDEPEEETDDGEGQLALRGLLGVLLLLLLQDGGIRVRVRDFVNVVEPRPDR